MAPVICKACMSMNSTIFSLHFGHARMQRANANDAQHDCFTRLGITT
jgi:hypothetical protein